MKLRVTVPATTSNLGPGFDTLGMALSLCNRVSCETGGEGLHIEINGEGDDLLPRDSSNLVVKAMDAVFEECDEARPPMRITIDNEIPTAGGLGGSASALVAGVMLANELLGGRLGRQEALLDFVTDLEGHPDNVAPCLLGGFVASSCDGHIVHAVRFEPPTNMVCVLCVPNLRSDTKLLRAALPSTVSFEDAVFNVGRTALLVSAIAKGRLDLLGRAMTDRLHEHVRAAHVPGYESVRNAAIHAGALACVLSGAGATIIAFCDRNRNRQGAVAEAMLAAFEGAGVDARTFEVTPRATGATLD